MSNSCLFESPSKWDLQPSHPPKVAKFPWERFNTVTLLQNEIDLNAFNSKNEESYANIGRMPRTVPNILNPVQLRKHCKAPTRSDSSLPNERNRSAGFGDVGVQILLLIP